MAILKIAEIGNPLLRQVARPVPDDKVRSEAVQQLIDDMIETMREYDGAGLAAPQVRHPVQIVVYEAAANPRYPEAPTIPLTVLINPTVTLLPGPRRGWEGCLSIPEMRGLSRAPAPCGLRRSTGLGGRSISRRRVSMPA